MSNPSNPALAGIQSTAGAIPVRNKKGEFSGRATKFTVKCLRTFYIPGEITMQKVKVHRYISGKRPEYAPDSSSEEESDHEDFIQTQKTKR